MKVIDLKPDAEMLGEVREYFPHQIVRKFQGDLANSIYQALKSGEKNIVVEAPTGLGMSLDVSPSIDPAVRPCGVVWLMGSRYLHGGLGDRPRGPLQRLS